MMECWHHGLGATEKKISWGKNNGQMNRIIFQPDGTPMVPIFQYFIVSSFQL
jgi:hypothetical protein